jgi:hypothetical protein
LARKKPKRDPEYPECPSCGAHHPPDDFPEFDREHLATLSPTEQRAEMRTWSTRQLMHNLPNANQLGMALSHLVSFMNPFDVLVAFAVFIGQISFDAEMNAADWALERPDTHSDVAKVTFDQRLDSINCIIRRAYADCRDLAKANPEIFHGKDKVN